MKKPRAVALGCLVLSLVFLAGCARGGNSTTVLGRTPGPAIFRQPTYPPCNVATQWHPPAGNVQFNDLDMVAPNEGWIVGNTVSDPQGVAQDGVLYHLLFGQLVQPPQTLPNTPLGDLSMASPMVGWAVPVADFLGEVDYAPIMRYSGGQWHLFDIPALDRTLKVGGLMPMSVQMFGPSAAWLFAVIGTPQDPSNPESRTGVTILRYINGVWSQMPSPPFPLTTQVFSFSAVSSDDAWVVGTDYSGGSQPKTVFAHFINGRWSIWPQSFPGGSQDITMVSSSNGWVVDYGSDPEHQVLLHYDGTTWTPVYTPSTWARQGVMLTSRVFPISSTITWFGAINSTSRSTNESQGELLEAYSNGQWQQVAWPDSHVEPVAIETDSGSELWAIGDITHQEGCGPGLVGNVEQGVLLHFDQGRWTEQVQP